MRIEANNIYIMNDVDTKGVVDRLLSITDYKTCSEISYDSLYNRYTDELYKHIPEDRLSRSFNGKEYKRPDIYFINGRYNDSDDVIESRISQYRELGSVFLGYFGINRRGKMQYVCKPAWQLHSIQGCLFSCAYCVLNNPILIIANTNDFLKAVEIKLRETPEQLLWQYDNETDIACFEPEYGVSQQLIELFASTDNQYLELYVGKSANVDWLLRLNHRGRTVCSFSMSGLLQSSLIEHRTDNVDNRLLAAFTLYHSGYPIRFRFSPIIPVRDWKSEYDRLIENIFSCIKPDVITLDILRNHNYHSIESCIGLELLDNRFIDIMKRIAPNTEIPNDYKIEVYSYIIKAIRQYSDISIALCRENKDVWLALEDIIGQRHTNYRCNCGPKTIPKRDAVC